MLSETAAAMHNTNVLPSLHNHVTHHEPEPTPPLSLRFTIAPTSKLAPSSHQLAATTNLHAHATTRKRKN